MSASCTRTSAFSFTAKLVSMYLCAAELAPATATSPQTLYMRRNLGKRVPSRKQTRSKESIEGILGLTVYVGGAVGAAQVANLCLASRAVAAPLASVCVASRPTLDRNFS